MLIFLKRFVATPAQGQGIKQDRRWNADKPSAALDPYMPT